MPLNTGVLINYCVVSHCREKYVVSNTMVNNYIWELESCPYFTFTCIFTSKSIQHSKTKREYSTTKPHLLVRNDCNKDNTRDMQNIHLGMHVLTECYFLCFFFSCSWKGCFSNLKKSIYCQLVLLISVKGQNIPG